MVVLLLLLAGWLAGWLQGVTAECSALTTPGGKLDLSLLEADVMVACAKVRAAAASAAGLALHAWEPTLSHRIDRIGLKHLPR